MDFTPFKMDIDELVDDYAKDELTTLADMKTVWAAKKFSFIYEARPNSNSSFFMQFLYSQALGHMVSEASLYQRLGGLYCLYCLYETQPYRPCFKIYVSLGELKRLRTLVTDAKQNGIEVVPALAKRMLDRHIFLFGLVDISGNSTTRNVEEVKKLQEKRVQIAYEKLFSYTRIEDYVHMNIGAELDLDALKRMSDEYSKAKESAITEASETVDVTDIQHIVEDKKSIGNRVEDVVKEWDAQKEEFYNQTGTSPNNEIVAVDEYNELERLLFDE